MAIKKKVVKKNNNKVSKILLGNRVEAASLSPNSKTINVFDGYKYSYIPNNSANIKELNKKLGKPSTSFYRGKNRKIWLDKNIY